MTYWKPVLGRLALSTASLAIIAGLGGFMGAILGAVFELMLQALAGLALEPLTVIPLFMILGLVLSLIWGLSLLVQNRTPASVTPPAGQ
jgi:hypothetical protein